MSALNTANRLVLTELIQRINVYLPWIDFGPTNPNPSQMHPGYPQSWVKYETAMIYIWYNDKKLDSQTEHKS